MDVKLIEFCTMDEREMLTLVQGIYKESNLENALWRHPELAQSQAVREEEQLFLDFLRAFMAKDENRYYVLACGSEWVSALRLTRLDSFYYLEALETAPEHRQKGFAAQLIQAVIRLLRQRGPVILRSNVDKENLPSLATHRKCGFVIEEENGVNHLSGKQSKYVYGMCYSEA